MSAMEDSQPDDPLRDYAARLSAADAVMEPGIIFHMSQYVAAGGKPQVQDTALIVLLLIVL